MHQKRLLFSLLLLLSIVNCAKSAVTSETENKTTAQWGIFLKHYLIKTSFGCLIGAACGSSCAYFEKHFFNNDPHWLQRLCSWSVFWVLKTSLIEGITQEMNANGIPCHSCIYESITVENELVKNIFSRQDKLIYASAELVDWLAYIFFKFR
jgi:hypothetical protein